MTNNEKITFKEWWANLKLTYTDPIKRKVATKDLMIFLGSLLRTILLIGLCFIIILPIIQKISTAIRDYTDINNPNVIFIPENVSLFTLTFAWELLDYGQTFWNTLLVSSLCTVIQVFSCAVAGYAFARLKFKGSNIIFYLVLLTLVVPNEALHRSRVLYLGTYSFFGIKLIGNVLSMFLISAFGQGIRSAIFIFLFRQSFKGIPIELEESAQVDGAGVLRTFWNVMLPNARGAIVTVSLFAFVWQWNDYYFASLFQYSEDTMPLLAFKLGSGSDAIASIISTWVAEGRNVVGGLSLSDATDPLFMSLITNTGALLMMLPLLIAYFFVQKLFVESIERTGITG